MTDRMDMPRTDANGAQGAGCHLEAVYGRIDEQRMRDLPIRNGRLSVEAVGFQPWDGHVIGVLVTPWCMNLVLMPGADDDWSDLAKTPVSKWELPAGAFQFNPCLFDDARLHLSTPLFSTVQDFPDQKTARTIAEEILRSLLKPAAGAGAVAAARNGERDHHADALMARPVSRRGLLRRLALLEP
jgi:[NiFe] hydrogenase assembly HybE family chaperone